MKKYWEISFPDFVLVNNNCRVSFPMKNPSLNATGEESIINIHSQIANA